MLYGKQYNGWITRPLYAWFIIDLFCKWQKIALDKNRLNYPNTLGVYDFALENWQTIDIKILQEMIEVLSQFHIENSDEDVIADEDGNEFSADFTSSNYFIFPIEILTILAIRKQIGLSNDIETTSDLMQLSINTLPLDIIPFPNDLSIIDMCKSKLKADNPLLEFEM